MTETPASLGYRMPAEWEPHEATWLAWPHNQDDWPGKFAPIPWVYAEIVRLISRFEPVRLVVTKKTEPNAGHCLEVHGVDLSRVRFFRAGTDRVWLRDSAPGFLIKESDGARSLALLDWRFNAWAKYDNHKKDNRLTRKIARELDMPRFKPRTEIDGHSVRLVLEGGAIDVNGRGSLLTTEECLLDPETQVRNPGLDRSGYEQVFADQLGIKNTIWLGRGIAGDDTHGHIDDIARFVNPSTVVAAVENDPSDPNFEPLRDNLERLKAARDQDGNPLSVVELPMPDPILFEGQRLPASYANFYIANGLVLVPTFNDPQDRHALNVLASVFPDRQVIGLHAVDLVLGLGTLHCLSREQPAV
jgi:agmatine deiminase